MEYLTVAETADLKGCSERYIKKLCKDSKLTCSIETNGKNRPKYMIPISSLPEDLQTKYYSQKRLEAGLEPEPVKKAVKQSKKAVKTSFEEFSEAEREEIALWVDILREWQNYRDKLVYPAMLKEIFGKAYGDVVKEDITYTLSDPAKRLLSASAYERFKGALWKVCGINIVSQKEPFRAVTQEDCSKLIEQLKRYVNTAERRAKRGEKCAGT